MLVQSFVSSLASRRIDRCDEGREKERKRKKEEEALKTIKRETIDVHSLSSPLFSSSLTPSAAASAASVAAPAPVAGLASVQGTRPESEEAQGGHSIFLSERCRKIFFVSFFCDFDLRPLRLSFFSPSRDEKRRALYKIRKKRYTPFARCENSCEKINTRKKEEEGGGGEELKNKSLSFLSQNPKKELKKLKNKITRCSETSPARPGPSGSRSPRLR